PRVLQHAAFHAVTPPSPRSVVVVEGGGGLAVRGALPGLDHADPQPVGALLGDVVTAVGGAHDSALVVVVAVGDAVDVPPGGALGGSPACRPVRSPPVRAGAGRLPPGCCLVAAAVAGPAVPPGGMLVRSGRARLLRQRRVGPSASGLRSAGARAVVSRRARPD